MRPNNWDLVKHAMRALRERWKYVYGTYGLVLDENIVRRKEVQYPNQIKKYLSTIMTYIGQRTVDCVGLFKSFLWWNDGKIKYDKNTDLSANGTFDAATEKGPVSQLPELPGLGLWRDGHVGIYIGNGQVIEAKGTLYGVIQSPLTGKGANKWTHWFKYPGIEYITEVEYYQRIIQQNMGFSYPEGIWAHVDLYPYSLQWYKLWVKSYGQEVF